MSERTKRLIGETMKRLMTAKSVEKIRVTELCRAAGIERPTFYYYFKDKYDLLAWIFAQGAENTDVLSVESAAEALRGMKRDLTFYRRAYEPTAQNALWEYMLEYFTARYIRAAEERLGAPIGEELRYAVRFYCCGSVGMTREWALRDAFTPAETVVRRMFDAMPRLLHDVFFGPERRP